MNDHQFYMICGILFVILSYVCFNKNKVPSFIFEIIGGIYMGVSTYIQVTDFFK